MSKFWVSRTELSREFQLYLSFSDFSFQSLCFLFPTSYSSRERERERKRERKGGRERERKGERRGRKNLALFHSHNLHETGKTFYRKENEERRNNREREEREKEKGEKEITHTQRERESKGGEMWSLCSEWMWFELCDSWKSNQCEAIFLRFPPSFFFFFLPLSLFLSLSLETMKIWNSRERKRGGKNLSNLCFSNIS